MNSYDHTKGWKVKKKSSDQLRALLGKKPKKDKKPKKPLASASASSPPSSSTTSVPRSFDSTELVDEWRRGQLPHPVTGRPSRLSTSRGKILASYWTMAGRLPCSRVLLDDEVCDPTRGVPVKKTSDLGKFIQSLPKN